MPLRHSSDVESTTDEILLAYSFIEVRSNTVKASGVGSSYCLIIHLKEPGVIYHWFHLSLVPSVSLRSPDGV